MALKSIYIKSLLPVFTLILFTVGCTTTQQSVQESQTDEQLESISDEDYHRAESFLGQHINSLVYNTVSNINWQDDGRITFLYTVPGGAEFMVADPSSNYLSRAFNHEALAETLSAITGLSIDDLSLPFRDFDFTNNGSAISFSVNGINFTCSTDGENCNTSENQTLYNRFTESLAPDGSKVAFIKEYNLWLRDLETGNETQLTFDGEKDFGYATNNAGWTKRDAPVLLWSPDSKRIATFQQDARNVKNMNLVSTAIGHGELQQWKYPLPGDEYIFMVERVIINLHGDEPELVRLNMEPDYQRSTITDHIAARDGSLLDAEWSSDGESLAFVSVSRDHKRVHLQTADPNSGEVKSILREEQDTFFESGINSISWRYLKDSNEFIWWSQRDNWGHLYLYDLDSGNLKNQITGGNWNVREIDHLDKQNRVIYFTGSVREEGDPYFQYLYKINFDGSGLTLLTPGIANHETSLNAELGYLTDTYSSPDTPPVTVIRDLDGNELMKLAEADISELEAHGWQPPTPFSVKARDGATDLYGLMYTPTNLDENRTYPVLNYLYPGPQSGSVGSRSFRASRSDKQAMAELGFIVVEVDAQGTPGRSKEFHDFYFGNMGDNGIPDQMAMIEQLAERHSFMDLNRVGIYGHSGGGFASTRAILDYPDFYHVAVSGAGNHDNRNYADAWGEKWQGLLEETPDGTNYDNQSNPLIAENLKGKLLITHGTLDTNVPHYNTLIVVDALIRANKDFDMIMLPNRGHGYYSEPFMMRKRWDYFVKHLKHTDPPKEFEFGQN